MVGLNRFSSDTQAELDLVVKKSMEYGAFKAVVADHWAQGGAGAVDLAKAVAEACSEPTRFKYGFYCLLILFFFTDRIYVFIYIAITSRFFSKSLKLYLFKIVLSLILLDPLDK